MRGRKVLFGFLWIMLLIFVSFSPAIAIKTTTRNLNENIFIKNDDFDPLVDIFVTFEMKSVRTLEDHLCNFWFKIIINENEFESQVWKKSRSLYDLDWTATVDVPDDVEEVEIKIKLFDDDTICDLNGKNEKKNVELKYNIKTGHWTGDDFLGDPSGYGRLSGCDDGSIYINEKDCELWFDIYQTDYDNDGIPYFVEVNNYLTDPEYDDSGYDYDFDKIPIEWEHKWGFDPNIWENHEQIDTDKDSINNYEEYLTSKWNSDPFRKDIFFEIDQMEKGPSGEGHFIPETTKELIFTIYNRRNIVYHYDDGSLGGGGEIVPFDYCTYNKELLKIYTNYFLHNNPNNWRRGVFHYGVFIYKHYSASGHCFVGEGSLINSNVRGINCFQVSTSAAEMYIETEKHARDFLYASYILHEGTHTFGIDIFNPMGCDNYNTVFPWMPGYYLYENYKSIMNYRYFPECQDLSDGTHGENDYDDWGTLDFTYFELPDSEPPKIPKKPTGSTEGKVGISYDYTTSTNDPNGEKVRYVWDWRDGSPHQWTEYIGSGDDITVSHIFEKGGTFEVRVRAEDIHGAYSYFSDPLIVNISGENHPPLTPTINGPNSGSPNKEYEFKFVAEDPDNDQVSFFIDWGDLSTNYTNFVSSGESVKVSHTWLDEGEYEIKVKAIDENGLESEPAYFEVKISKGRFRIYDFVKQILDFLFEFYKFNSIRYCFLSSLSPTILKPNFS